MPDDLAVDGVDELLKVFVAYSVGEWVDYFTEALKDSPAYVPDQRSDATADSAGRPGWLSTSPGHFDRRRAARASPCPAA